VEKTSDKIVSMNQPSRLLNEIKSDVVFKGDTNAYIELDIVYNDLNHEEFIYYALVMANKYDYPQAYFDVYWCLTELYKDFSEIDSLTMEMSLKYLTLAADKGHSQAREVLEDFRKSSSE